MTANLDTFATELVAHNNFIKASFAGFAGSGKTRTGSEFIVGAYKDFKCQEPLLLIDNENGSRFLIPYFRAALPGVRVLLKETESLADILEALELVNRKEIGALFIDTMTKVYYRFVRDYMSANHAKFMTLGDWGKVIPSWQDQFANTFVRCMGNVVFTGRGGFSYEKEEDEVDPETGKKTKGQFVKSGVKMKLAGDTPFEPDLNVWMSQHQEVGVKGTIEVWREGFVLKDRSGQIDGNTFKHPTYENFRPVVSYLLHLPTGDVAGESNSNNLAPKDNFESFDRKRRVTAALEEIDGALGMCFPSNSAGDKRARDGVIHAVFETHSRTKLEAMQADKLECGFKMITTLCKRKVDGEVPNDDNFAAWCKSTLVEIAQEIKEEKDPFAQETAKPTAILGPSPILPPAPVSLTWEQLTEKVAMIAESDACKVAFEQAKSEQRVYPKTTIDMVLNRKKVTPQDRQVLQRTLELCTALPSTR